MSIWNAGGIAVVQDMHTIMNQPQMAPPVTFNHPSRLGFIRNVATNRNLEPSNVASGCPVNGFILHAGDANNDESDKLRWIQTEGHVG